MLVSNQGSGRRVGAHGAVEAARTHLFSKIKLDRIDKRRGCYPHCCNTCIMCVRDLDYNPDTSKKFHNYSAHVLYNTKLRNFLAINTKPKQSTIIKK